ncbi:MAG: hypothetical protein ACM3ML_07525 [Micromonosporaceae bacterium]
MIGAVSQLTAYNFSFWLHIDTAETSATTAYDKLTVRVISSAGTVLATLATYSNLDHKPAMDSTVSACPHTRGKRSRCSSQAARTPRTRPLS